jgi:hypothetical protein
MRVVEEYARAFHAAITNLNEATVIAIAWATPKLRFTKN